jgi:hypothetical protein
MDRVHERSIVAATPGALRRAAAAIAELAAHRVDVRNPVDVTYRTVDRR